MYKSPYAENISTAVILNCLDTAVINWKSVHSSIQLKNFEKTESWETSMEDTSLIKLSPTLLWKLPFLRTKPRLLSLSVFWHKMSWMLELLMQPGTSPTWPRPPSTCPEWTPSLAGSLVLWILRPLPAFPPLLLTTTRNRSSWQDYQAWGCWDDSDYWCGELRLDWREQVEDGDSGQNLKDREDWWRVHGQQIYPAGHLQHVHLWYCGGEVDLQQGEGWICCGQQLVHWQWVVEDPGLQKTVVNLLSMVCSNIQQGINR